jgi:hypothetical protein
MSRGFNAIKTLFVGGRSGASLGRVLLITTYVICMYKWTREPQGSEYLFYSLIAFMTYVFSGKVAAKFGPVTLNTKSKKKEEA